MISKRFHPPVSNRDHKDYQNLDTGIHPGYPDTYKPSLATASPFRVGWNTPMGPYDIILGNGFSGTEGPIFVGPVGKKAPKSTKSAGKKGRE